MRVRPFGPVRTPVPFRVPSFVLLFLLACGGGATTGGAAGGPAPVNATARDASVPPEVALQRRAAGLIVTRTSEGWIAVRVRGAASDNEEATRPLYVLNGNPFHPGPGGTLVGIDPDQIATLKYLRPAESGLYGIEGANGVVVITTSSSSRRPTPAAARTRTGTRVTTGVPRTDTSSTSASPAVGV